MVVSRDCLQFVQDFIRYFYTRKLYIKLLSVKCLHNMASNYGVTAIRDYCDKLFYKLLPQDPSFKHQLELYQYAGLVNDLYLQAICLQYFAWHCEAFSRSDVWNQMSAAELDALLQRSDLVIQDEFTLFQAVEAWIVSNEQTALTDQLMGNIRFHMMTPEILISIPINSSLYQLSQNTFIPKLLQAFEFHSVPVQKLKYYRNISDPQYHPRTYTSSDWSTILPITSSHETSRKSLFVSQAPYFGRSAWYDHSYNPNYSSPSSIFQTPEHMSQLYSSRKLSWSAWYHKSALRCRNSNVICPYDTYPVAALTTASYSIPASITYHNRVLLLCDDHRIAFVQDMKNSTAVIPSLNTTGLFLFPCNTGVTSISFVVRPIYI
ncbi:galectin-3-binding protein-like [Chiloscyllium plagiosum]|uniref:galectin-3-binding protein-like n=1 Tax=Chiloscyllium plagiosum TaxID=36176 RepID=UPI001CB8245F|nr:galectin-3-binding protein-like [Chiloscyllium plagiosum]